MRKRVLYKLIITFLVAMMLICTIQIPKAKALSAADINNWGANLFDKGAEKWNEFKDWINDLPGNINNAGAAAFDKLENWFTGGSSNEPGGIGGTAQGGRRTTSRTR